MCTYLLLSVIFLFLAIRTVFKNFSIKISLFLPENPLTELILLQNNIQQIWVVAEAWSCRNSLNEYYFPKENKLSVSRIFENMRWIQVWGFL